MLHVVLYQPEIPYNTGNIGRSCLTARAKLWLVHPLGFKLDHKHLRRAGIDYWEQLDWEAVGDWAALEQRLGDARMWLCTKNGTRPYYDAQYAEGDALVFGSESSGLPPSLLQKHEAQLLRIPMSPNVRCLNLAVAAGIVLFEARRQLGGLEPR